MRILHTVEFYHPSVGGMQEVVRQLSERLASRGHSVTVATSKIPARTEFTLNGVNIIEFSVSGNAVRGLQGETEKYKDYLLSSDFDVVTNFAAQQWATDLMLPIMGRIKAAKVFVPTGFSGLYAPEYRRYFEEMKVFMRKYDMNVFLSEDYRDINYALAHGIEKRILIPNGAGEDEFSRTDLPDIRSKYGIPPENTLILHVGSHTGGKGHTEAIEIFRRAKIKNATLLIAGNYFPSWETLHLDRLRKVKRQIAREVFSIAFKLFGHVRCPEHCHKAASFFNSSRARASDGKSLLIHSLERDEVLAAYRTADLFLFPSNIECSPLVLFECMASKTPYLTTDVGNAREIIEWSGSGLMLPTKRVRNGNSKAEIRGAVRMLEDLCGDISARQEMAERGYQAWKDRFTWEKLTLDYEALYESLIK